MTSENAFDQFNDIRLAAWQIVLDRPEHFDWPTAAFDPMLEAEKLGWATTARIARARYLAAIRAD